MDTLRRIMLFVASAAFAICCLFMNILGGIAIISNGGSYSNVGINLIVSTIILAFALLFTFFRKTVFNILSVIFNTLGSAFYIIAVSVLNGIPNTVIPSESIEILTSRIYPSVIVTLALGIAVFADYLSPERSAKREEKKRIRQAEKDRALTDEEKIL